MGRPAKTATVLEKSGGHRTKQELAVRKEAEKGLLSGKPLRESTEVKADPVSHAEFVRVRQLLRSIGKDDGLYSATVNRYCLLQAECLGLQQRGNRISEALEDAVDPKDCANLSKCLADLDRLLLGKRKMMFDIEQAMCMTVASALRSIPKKPEQKVNPLMEALRDG